MPINVANFYESPRYSAVAGEDATQGMVVKIEQDAAGERRLYKLLDADAAELVAGNYGVIYKVSEDPDQVESSTAPTPTRDRVPTILSGDAVVEVRRGAIIEYTADLLHSSLDPDRAGTTPAATDTLALKDSQWCTTGTGSAITSPVVGRVYKVYGTNVLVELVAID